MYLDPLIIVIHIYLVRRLELYLQIQLKTLNLFYKMDLGFWICFGWENSILFLDLYGMVKILGIVINTVVFSGSNTDGLFTAAVLNSLLSALEQNPTAADLG